MKPSQRGPEADRAFHHSVAVFSTNTGVLGSSWITIDAPRLGAERTLVLPPVDKARARSQPSGGAGTVLAAGSGAGGAGLTATGCLAAGGGGGGVFGCGAAAAATATGLAGAGAGELYADTSPHATNTSSSCRVYGVMSNSTFVLFCDQPAGSATSSTTWIDTHSLSGNARKPFESMSPSSLGSQFASRSSCTSLSLPGVSGRVQTRRGSLFCRSPFRSSGAIWLVSSMASTRVPLRHDRYAREKTFWPPTTVSTGCLITANRMFPSTGWPASLTSHSSFEAAARCLPSVADGFTS